ncbi:MAG: methyltransferase domain-containing protein [Anaerolineae bacterium]|nr:methyltransferase domain-containing protein [Candidatus Roseilinea sp.]MDW8449804.1 methyltransferase domain-containing protein [Anaerolineae bacterium]
MEHPQQTNPSLLSFDRFPRSSTYDPAWIIENAMGPNVLWLTEFLCEAMDLRSGMRVLDLGCGKALSSIFLAREFGLQVWATDLWIPATENARRVREAQLDDCVFPIHADARALPFAEEFFDAIVSIDAFEYFGTDVHFISSLVRLLKPNCQVGVVNAGLKREVERLPDEWPDDFCAFHTVAWWRRHWEITRCVEVELADDLPQGRELWLRWHAAIGVTDDAYLTSPAGENLTFHRIVGRRKR